MKKEWKDRGIILITFLVFLFFMAFQISHSAYWYDEWIELKVSQIPYNLMYGYILNTFQPPLYNFLAHIWLKFSPGTVWLRLMNIPIGLLSGVFLYKLMRRKSSVSMSCLSVLLLGISYQFVYISQESSEYALVIMALFFFLWMYLRAIEKPTLINMILLALGAGLSAYSQYGCVFVVVPVLILYFVKTVVRGDKKDICSIILVYIGAFVFLAIPLYWFFARIQLANHNIGHVTLPVIWSIRDFFMKLGGIFLYSFISRNVNENLFTLILGIVIFSANIIGLVWSYHKKDERGQVFCYTLLFSFLMDYFLTVYHIYGMVTADISAGLYCRYSVFFLTLLPCWIPSLCELFLEKKGLILCTVILLCIGIFSVPNILRNWEKSHDEEIAAVWAEKHDPSIPTVLFGVAENPFDYYARYNYPARMEENTWREVYTPEVPVKYTEWYDSFGYIVNSSWRMYEVWEFPDRFYLWFGDYGLDQATSFEDMFHQLEMNAKAAGYQEEYLTDFNELGNLVYFHK